MDTEPSFMKVGIDISQLAYRNTGVANYLESLVTHLLDMDNTNEYVLFYSSFRGTLPSFDFAKRKNVTIKTAKLSPKMLDILWNRFHLLPIESFVGDVDIFITSDWTEPPAKKAKKLTILYDLIVYKHPEETAKQIVETQKRKLAWVKKESAQILCISEATKKDAISVLGIDEKRLSVVYPGM